MKKNSKHKSTYLSIKYDGKYLLELKSIEVLIHDSREAALGYSYAKKDCSYVYCPDKNNTIVWCGNPWYRVRTFDFVWITKENLDKTYFDMSDNYTKNMLKNLLNAMVEDWRLSKSVLYIDNSIEMARMAWQTTIPKGYKLLRVGSTIKEDDMEYHKFITSGYGWSAPNWYNIGKKVKEGIGMAYQNEKGVIYKRTKGDQDPIIVRKNDKV